MSDRESAHELLVIFFIFWNIRAGDYELYGLPSLLKTVTLLP